MTTLPVGKTGAHLRILRESLGLGRMEFANLLNARSKTIANWEGGRSYIPDGAFEDALSHLREMHTLVDRLVTELCEEEHPTLRTFATDDAFHEAFPHLPYTAGWHRMVVARVRERVPNLNIVF